MILRGRGMSIDLLDVRVFAGEGVGFVTCTEVMEAGDSRGRCVGGLHLHLQSSMGLASVGPADSGSVCVCVCGTVYIDEGACVASKAPPSSALCV